MPLRAKILNPAMQDTRSYATSNDIHELPGDMPDDVVFNSSSGLRTIELNRPKKLNSLDGSMCRKIVPRLREWEKSDMVNAVVMKGAGDRALCAGGDVALLAKLNQEGKADESASYFALEYKLDHLIATYTKPYIAFMDGATMGGGVGLSAHAPFRIATERTVLAMPETRIGFFPEVGASFFLPRLDGALGRYLALTSENLRGVQAFYHGIATHYLHSSSLPDLEQRLGELRIPDYTSYTDRLKLINQTITEFNTGLPHDQPIQLSGELRRTIDYCFGSYNIKSILWRLEKTSTHPSVPEAIQKWASKTIKTMGERSPTSLKVTLRQMSLGKSWNIAEAFKREYLIAHRFMHHPDFVEGVSARLISKKEGIPDWKPATLDEVTDEQVDSFFSTPEGLQPLQLLNTGSNASYMQYPHAWLGLPTEQEIEKKVNSSPANRQSIVKFFVTNSGMKIGVKEKVDEVLDRMTLVDDRTGMLSWNFTMTPVEKDSRERPDRKDVDPERS